MRSICVIEGCGLYVNARGYCPKHYARWKLYGDPLATARDLEANRRLTLFRSLMAIRSDECTPPWPHAHGAGYPGVSVGGRWICLHRVACELTYGPAPTKLHQAAHSCGNKGCVNPRHLRWATPAENEADKLIHGRSNRGSRCGTSKLTEAQVDEIVRRRSAGERGVTLAAEFGVAPTTICAITKGRRWPHHTGVQR